MFSKFFNYTYQYVGFEDVLLAIKNENDRFIMLNVLSHSEQPVLIKNTIHSQEEEDIINTIIQKKECQYKTVIIYGKNNCDLETETKYKKLQNCGFGNIAIYNGGLFEWLLLQEIYGFSNFPTTTRDIDILKYRPTKKLATNLISY
jgi:hypothetical protein|uniref:Rhodanese domain-containing protein n=1 Tax=viral metagenome TaxID=1070528 RepID=A0A6C0ILY6_9ZZZZ